MRPKTTGLAKRLLKSYRIWKHAGYTSDKARYIAEFGIVCMSGGRTNLYAQNRIKFYHRNDKRTKEED